MADAMLGEANFTRQPGGSLAYIAQIFYETSVGVFDGESRIQVPVQAADTGAVFIARLVAAVDTEATRLGLAAPTRIFGTGISKFR